MVNRGVTIHQCCCQKSMLKLVANAFNCITCQNGQSIRGIPCYLGMLWSEFLKLLTTCLRWVIGYAWVEGKRSLSHLFSMRPPIVQLWWLSLEPAKIIGARRNFLITAVGITLQLVTTSLSSLHKCEQSELHYLLSGKLVRTPAAQSCRLSLQHQIKHV